VALVGHPVGFAVVGVHETGSPVGLKVGTYVTGWQDGAHELGELVIGCPVGSLVLGPAVGLHVVGFLLGPAVGISVKG